MKQHLQKLSALLFLLFISNSVVASKPDKKETLASARSNATAIAYPLQSISRNFGESNCANFTTSCGVQAAFKVVAKPCAANNGRIELAGSNGIAPYTYSLDNGTTFQNKSLFENLAAGNYTALVKDANGCISEPLQINLISVPTPSVTLSLPYTSFCVSSNAFTPSGGFPAGGFYNGPGMVRGKFYPSRAGIGTHTLTYSYMNESGCIGTASQTITVYPFASVSAGPDKVVYLGYKPASCTQLTASINSDNTTYTYRWSTGATTPTIEVCPEQTTTYAVTATDISGCSTTDEVTVYVYDVRCGTKLDKVAVCHNGTSMCLVPEAVAGHLSHGDVLGDCETGPRVITEDNQVEVYPNPVKERAQVKLKLKEQDVITVDIVSTQGKTVQKLYKGKVVANEELIFDIDKSLGHDRVYIGRLVTSNKVQYFKIIFTE